MRVFFYGLFMDESLLATKGIEPFEVNLGFVEGFELRIGERATLVRRAGSRSYGAMMEIAPAEASELYAEESVADYVPEPVIVELMDGRRVEATCYNLPGDKMAGANEEYAESLLNVATRLNFPDSYLDQIRQARTQQADSQTSFHYEGREVVFQCFNSEDHILNIMRRRRTFYEIDVLERIRDRLGKRDSSGTALDIGAFVGTHSVYFSMFCGCRTVYSFEANPETFPILERNLRRNGVEKTVFPKNLALGATPGRANILRGASSNIGLSSVDYVADGTVEVSTVDDQVAANSFAAGNVALMKIDVEGAEPEVLSGASETVRSHSPILCIEAHTRENLREILHLLRDCQYRIVDCLGYSPTYILEPTKSFSLHRSLVNRLWLIRASSKSRIMKWLLRRLGQLSTTGIWNPVSASGV